MSVARDEAGRRRADTPGGDAGAPSTSAGAPHAWR